MVLTAMSFSRKRKVPSVQEGGPLLRTPQRRAALVAESLPMSLPRLRGISLGQPGRDSGTPAETVGETLRRKRASDRQKKYKNVEVIPGRTLVETLSVTAPVRREYMRLICCLLCWLLGLSSRALPPRPPLAFPVAVESLDMIPLEHVDDELIEWIDAALRQGEPGNAGQKMIAALGWCRAGFRKGGEVQLTRSRVGALALQRRAPGCTRLPLPEEVVMAMACVMFVLSTSNGRALPDHGLRIGLAIMLSHHLYLRPGELMRVRFEWLIPAASGSGQVGKQMSVILHPQEEGVRSKTGVSDETLIIDDPDLVRCLESLRKRHQSGLLVPVSAKELSRFWEQAARALDLERSLGMPHLYVLRHSGASADMMLKRRSLAEIKSRGRWRSDSSVRRYEKGGRSLERLAALSVPTRAYVLKCAQRVWAVLALRSLPLSLPRLGMR